ncbi:ribophorin I family protein [Mitosporidium daphniae]|uniref:Dolichyl-diphosphooligosaccharide--protein glycosyltransferase subunit 1 n=1 Tax=Mitosporidium daphniae TaxID=1485682 RepID=A0A098VPA5_9MICR|nr:ribophorin I family protein [Mitosporidium daphniae]KGG50649.1 ribophorin I family protein [Mitosporidium daphniae]|eukprot:XP_013237076.1 ribophorin I family protein [Mitosporidium daphniae]
MKDMPFILPSDAYDVTYRDEVGLISTSDFIEHEGMTIFNCRPRYPVFGGWASSFEIHYKLPIADRLHKTKSGVHYVELKVGQLALDAITSSFKMDIVLPETSKLLAHNYNKIGFKTSILTFRTNLGIFDSPVIQITSNNVLDDLLGDEIKIEFEYSLTQSFMSKCFFLYMVFQLLFIAFICYKLVRAFISKLIKPSKALDKKLQ